MSSARKAAALDLAGRGWKVLPLHHVLRDGACTCQQGQECDSKGKHPRWHATDLPNGLISASSDVEQVKRWWHRWPMANPGVATGAASGFWVLDVDPRHDGDETLAALVAEHGELPHTVESLTGGGGRHLLFLMPEGFEIRNIQRKPIQLGPGLDVRGSGGLIVAPGAVHATGAAYQWEASSHPDEVAIAAAPEWVLTLIQKAMAAGVNGNGTAQPIPDVIPHGTQHLTLVSLAGSMRARGMDVEEIDAALQVINARRCERPGPPENIRKIAESAGNWQPGTPPHVDVRHTDPPRGPCLASGLPEDPALQAPRNGASATATAEAAPAPPKPIGPDDWFSEEEEPAEPAEVDADTDLDGLPDLTQEDLLLADADSLDGEGKGGPSELTLARAWAKKVGKRLLFFEGGRWARYSMGRWIWTSSEAAISELQAHLVACRANQTPGVGKRITVSAEKVRNVFFLARNLLGPHEVTELDAHPTWIPLVNGVYDTETGVLLPHSPDHLLTVQLPYAYDPEATCPRWERFLEETLITDEGEPCEEWLQLMQEWYGYCLVPDNRAHAAMVWIGEGRNGKGVATRILERLVGSTQTCAIPVEQLHEPYQRAQIQGKLVGLVNEPDPRAMARNGTYFKAITGEDLVDARQPTEKVFSFKPTCRIVISCNSLPATRDFSRGYFDRLMMIGWRREFTREERDTGLSETLARELPGIFNWALAGLRRFRDRGSHFPESPESDRLLSDYRSTEDTVLLFIQEECEQDPEHRIHAGGFSRAYRAWCAENGFERPLNTTAVGRRLTALGYRAARTGTNRWRYGLRINPTSRFTSYEGLADEDAPPEGPQARLEVE